MFISEKGCWHSSVVSSKGSKVLAKLFNIFDAAHLQETNNIRKIIKAIIVIVAKMYTYLLSISESTDEIHPPAAIDIKANTKSASQLFDDRVAKLSLVTR